MLGSTPILLLKKSNWWNVFTRWVQQNDEVYLRECRNATCCRSLCRLAHTDITQLKLLAWWTVGRASRQWFNYKQTKAMYHGVKHFLKPSVLFFSGFEAIPSASSQGWCWNKTFAKKGDKDLCRANKNAKILVSFPIIIFIQMHYIL